MKCSKKLSPVGDSCLVQLAAPGSSGAVKCPFPALSSPSPVRTDADVLLPVVHQPLVHLVADAQHVVLHTQLCNQPQLPAAEHLQQAQRAAEMQQGRF